MPYASCLVSFSVVSRCSSSKLACPIVLCLMQLSLSEDLGLCSLFYLGYICIALWDSLSVPVHSGIACLVCDWLPFVRCPSKHVYCKTDHDWLPL